MKIVMISDLHGDLPELPDGDLLIVGGDCTGWDKAGDWLAFSLWIEGLGFEKKILIGGNHDNYLQNDYRNKFGWNNLGVTYLEDSGTEFEGLRIWGSPWTVKFSGQNPAWAAFTEDEELDLIPHWNLIPEDTDILVTHSPPFDILDAAEKYTREGQRYRIRTGSPSLRERVLRTKPLLHVFGHIHAGYGTLVEDGVVFINAARMNEDYYPGNPPWVVEIEEIQDLGRPECQVTQLLRNLSDS